MKNTDDINLSSHIIYPLWDFFFVKPYFYDEVPFANYYYCCFVSVKDDMMEAGREVMKVIDKKMGAGSTVPGPLPDISIFHRLDLSKYI